MRDPEKEFPAVRTLGTIGWIISGLLLGSSFLKGGGGDFVLQLPEFISGKEIPGDWVSISATNIPFVIGAVVSVGLGIYCFTLPNTPPKLKGKSVTVGEVLGLKALRLLKDRSFAVFVVSSFFICIPLAFYYQSANGFLKEMGMENSEWKMTYGQMSEIVFLLAVPFFFRRLGVKKMLVIGMLAWVLRYFLFAGAEVGDMTFLYLGIVLHGICYDFFFVTGQLYVDREAPKDIRASAQGFIALVTYGVGMLIGNTINGAWVERNTKDGEIDWQAVWSFPAYASLIVVVLFFIFFKERIPARDKRRV